MADAIGRLRRRIVIEVPVETPDGAGGVIRSFADGATVWAAVEPARAAFGLFADRAGQAITHRITLRTGPQLSVQHRLRDGTRTYTIRSVETADPGDRFLVALTEEISG